MIENEIFELWKNVNPSSAFSQGLNEYAGKLFIPTKGNKKRVLQKIGELRNKADEIENRFLDYLETSLLFEEPPECPSIILWTFFAHISKEGINTGHLIMLSENSIKLVNAYSKMEYNWPVEIRILTYRGCKGLIGILENIEKQTKDEKLKKGIRKLELKVKDYMKNFFVPGLDKCDFSEIYPILKEKGREMDRSEIYPQLLKNLYDYPETPEEIEEKALGWLEKEMPMLKKITKELARIYNVEENVEKVSEEMTKRRKIERRNIVSFILSLREKLRKVMEKNLVRITPKYNTKVIETPEYLLAFIPSAAMSAYDTLTESPFNVYFTTTNEKFSPPAGSPDIFQTLVHEEFGHCVNFTNSAVGFAYKPALLENINTTFHYPISEGISFHRESESLNLLKQLASREELNNEERELVEYIKSFGEFETFLKEAEFVVEEWRIIRFLRAIGDVRINTGKSSITDFVDWAHDYTGLSKKMVFNQIFLFQENPGYAPCYSIAGMSLKEIQDKARENGKNILEFNTIASSMGFPPRTVFEERLKQI
ncbi:MAG: hypothetical protein QMC80_07875 [Thermoplasmatales archaeon]|nr:hypothetical protein [Thermoplasmatales archaeon]